MYLAKGERTPAMALLTAYDEAKPTPEKIIDIDEPSRLPRVTVTR